MQHALVQTYASRADSVQTPASTAPLGGAPAGPTGAESEEQLSTATSSDKPSHLFRLFVGWVPQNYAERDLLPLFNQHGVVRDIIILKDKVTNQPRGCAFVSYATKEEAEVAIQKLDRQLQLPGALSPLEVRFAKSHHYVQAGDGPDNNRQLFFSNTPTELNEEQICTFFSQFGAVEEVNLFRERKSGKSKGCGFITMQHRDQAMRAMEVLENKSGEPSEGVQVQWADPDLQFKKKKALEESNADNRMLFFAKVLRSATEEEVKQLFTKYGKVYDVNLFRAFQGAPTSKGCGLVTMASHAEALAAIDALDNRYCWDGMDSPMVVKWMDAALQRRRREQHLAAMRQGLVPNMLGPADAWMPQHALALGAMPAPGAARLSLGPAAQYIAPVAAAAEPELTETPPCGCAADAMKLFVGNIPKTCTEDQLLPFFETIGKVVELVIVRDKATHESKGSAFVWYATRAHAERAILQFNLRHVLPDPAGEQDRPLVVRKAKSRVGKGGAPHMAAMAAASGGVHPMVGSAAGMGGQQQQHPAISMLMGGHHQPMAVNIGPQGTTYYTAAAAPPNKLMHGGAMHLAGGLEGLPSQAIAMQAQPGSGYAHMAAAAAGGYRTMQQLPGAHLVSIQAAPAVADAGLYEAYGAGGGGPGDQMEPYMTAATSSGSGHLDSMGGHAGHMQQQVAQQQQQASQQQQQVALSLSLNPQQLSTVNSHLFSVQTMSGAQLHISPGAPGLFHLVVSGSKLQVDNARSLLTSVLSGQQGTVMM